MIFVYDYNNREQQLFRKTTVFTLANAHDDYFKDYLLTKLERKHVHCCFGEGVSRGLRWAVSGRLLLVSLVVPVLASEVIFAYKRSNREQSLLRRTVAFTVANLRDDYLKDYLIARLERKHVQGCFGEVVQP